MKLLTLFTLSAMTFNAGVPIFNLGFDTVPSQTNENIYSSTVLSDLSEMPGFSIDDRRENFDFIQLSEYCYSGSKDEIYNLFLYFYIDPTQYSNWNQSGDNYIQLGLGSNPSSYAKYSLKTISYQSGYIKACISEKTSRYNIWNQLDAESRIYNLSGITLQFTSNGSNPYKEFGVSGKFTYTGKAFGIDGTKVSSLKCDYEKLETIDLNLVGGTWATEENCGWKNIVYYVNFGLGREYTEKYGSLKSIHFEYDECILKPLFHFADGYDYLQPKDAGLYRTYFTITPYYMPTNISDNDENKRARWVPNFLANKYDYSLFNWKEDFNGIQKYGNEEYDSDDSYEESNTNRIVSSAFNNLSQEPMIFQPDTTNVTFRNANVISSRRVFTSADKGDEVSAAAIQQRVEQYPNDLIDTITHRDVTLENDSEYITIPTSQRASNLGFNISNSKVAGWVSNSPDNVSYSDLNTWDVVDLDDSSLATSSFASKYFVEANDVNGIKSRLTENNANGKDTYLFRFDMEHFFHQNIRSTNYQHIAGGGDGVDVRANRGYTKGYFWNSYYMKDFDIISFTFEQAGRETLLPVISTPINIATTGYPTVMPSSGNVTSSLTKIIAIVLAVFFVLIAIYALVRILPSWLNYRTVKASSKAAVKVEKEKTKRNKKR